MQKYEASRFTAEAPWGGPTIAAIADAQVKLRWIDRPFEWHANTGEEVFVVLDGEVDMQVRAPGGEVEVIPLGPGDILHIAPGDAHVAHPRGEARVLVIEGADEA
jgi:mannose-6-phosphate isomerase-like protein (cupin superfamily)